MSVAELFSLFKQGHDHECGEPAFSNDSEESGYELPQLDSRSLVDGKLAELAEHEAQERHKVLGHHRCKAKVALGPEVEVPVHAEISSPGVIVYGAEGVVEVSPSHSWDRGQEISHVENKAHEAEQR